MDGLVGVRTETDEGPNGGTYYTKLVSWAGRGGRRERRDAKSKLIRRSIWPYTRSHIMPLCTQMGHMGTSKRVEIVIRQWSRAMGNHGEYQAIFCTCYGAKYPPQIRHLLTYPPNLPFNNLLYPQYVPHFGIPPFCGVIQWRASSSGDTLYYKGIQKMWLHAPYVDEC